MPTFTFWNFINYSTQKCRPYLPRTVVLGLGVFAVVVVYSWMQRFPQRLWWIELKQNVHYDVVEGDIWHTTPDMLDHKYKKNYRMSFLAFEHLVSEQILFFTSHWLCFMRLLGDGQTRKILGEQTRTTILNHE